MPGARQGTRAQKTRSEVSGGGKTVASERYWSCSCWYYPLSNLAFGGVTLRLNRKITARR